jgi:hypothetical protein
MIDIGVEPFWIVSGSGVLGLLIAALWGILVRGYARRFNWWMAGILNLPLLFWILLSVIGSPQTRNAEFTLSLWVFFLLGPLGLGWLLGCFAAMLATLGLPQGE